MAQLETQRRRGFGCLVFMLVAFAGLGLVGLGLVGLYGAAGGSADPLHEVVESQRADAEGKRVVVIEATGVMIEGGGLGSPPGLTRRTLMLLKHARTDDRVKGVLLRLDTPGGSVTEADLLHHEIQAVREAGKPVVLLMGDLCASGGYYAAVAANEIWALPTTITGSIGVILQGLNVSELMARHGVQDTSLTSGPNKAMLSPTRPVNPAQQALAQAVVDELYQRFVELVAAGRKLDEPTVKALADGRIFTARAALEAKLIDGIGHRERALERTKQLSGAGPFDVVRYEAQPSFFDLLRARAAAPANPVMELADALATPRALALYAPPWVGR